MQNIADEKLKADAARLGFHKKPMEGLIKVVEAKVQEAVQQVETKLKIKKEKLSNKLEALKNNSFLINKDDHFALCSDDIAIKLVRISHYVMQYIPDMDVMNPGPEILAKMPFFDLN